MAKPVKDYLGRWVTDNGRVLRTGHSFGTVYSDGIVHWKYNNDLKDWVLLFKNGAKGDAEMAAFQPGQKVRTKSLKTPYKFIAYDHTSYNGAIVECDGKLIRVDYDYIETAPEPHKVCGWVNVYKNNTDVRMHESRQEADAHAFYDRIACVYVTGTEGIEP